jgi:hypothetical protein
MKTKIGLLTLAGLMTAGSFQPVLAGDREWATAGKVLTGVMAGSILARAFEPAPTVVYAPPPVYYTQTVVAAPPAPMATIANAPVVQAAPVVGQPVVQPVYVQQPAPVVVYQQPVYVAPAPVYYYPRPVIGFHFGFGGGYHSHYGHGHYRRW